ncbi:precorrin-6y C5,15-methyltransferase (decarboxylating) subunit CbiE [Gordonia alkanivorans]|uniref:precorrin-6y C5,15-methyltransferase (decarboxylating) subunit CbiE n=1 Tax=Gordonia alkanivorans TaxID=84096 RepID=UPI00244D7A11|nr:precorrin-6y C5,15-methyltransferase (decarboxylating) subunit CbiE [Gordonia alkanivorans]MDH3044243.1 precorrin-6y C5,15-methyltransferase (decarboxylating) subunit CbiE [Gordonia alkanivorans]
MSSTPSNSGVPPRFVVVGIGADGWRGLGDAARDELRGAHVIYGARRQLALLDDAGHELTGTREVWRSPMSSHLAEVLENATGRVHILASGDPMFHGVGASIVARVGPDQVRVVPTVSSASLACARLGWDLATTRIVSAVTADPEVVLTEVTGGGRLLVLSRNEMTPASVSELLSQNGFGDSSMTVLEQLGGPDERIRSSTAESWAPSPVDPLNIVAVDCVGARRSRMPGRDDDTYDHDGQITKSTIRAITVAALEPAGAQLLWDIGSGSGSVAIEWLRADDRGRAVAFEQNADRAERLTANARRHGVGHRLTLRGAAPEALSDAPPPDAVFIGGGLDEKVLTSAWNALRPSGRIVVNAVTVENQEILVRWHAERGGTLRRLSVETVAPLGTMSTWRPALPIVQWAATRDDTADKAGSTT